MVKDHSDSEKGNPLLPHRLLFPISSKGSFICTIPQTGKYIPRALLHQSWSTGWNEKYNNKETLTKNFEIGNTTDIGYLEIADINAKDTYTGHKLNKYWQHSVVLLTAEVLDNPLMLEVL